MMGMDKLKEDAKDWSGDATVAVIDSGIDEDHPCLQQDWIAKTVSIWQQTV